MSENEFMSPEDINKVIENVTALASIKDIKSLKVKSVMKNGNSELIWQPFTGWSP